MARLRGLTLIEVLIVVIVLGLLAAIVTPQFSRADHDSRLDMLKSSLLDIRAQIRLYRTQHEDRNPQLDLFVEQMTAVTTVDGGVTRERTGAYGLGPYMKVIPPNPYTGAARIGDGDIGTSDWYYDQSTGFFRANHDPDFISY